MHTNNFGMWLGLDPGELGVAKSVGTGIVKNFKPIGVYPIRELLSNQIDT